MYDSSPVHEAGDEAVVVGAAAEVGSDPGFESGVSADSAVNHGDHVVLDTAEAVWDGEHPPEHGAVVQHTDHCEDIPAESKESHLGREVVNPQYLKLLFTRWYVKESYTRKCKNITCCVMYAQRVVLQNFRHDFAHFRA